MKCRAVITTKRGDLVMFWAMTNRSVISAPLKRVKANDS